MTYFSLIESGTTTKFLYDGFSPIIERNSEDTITAVYTRGIRYPGGIGGIISQKQIGESTFHYHHHYDGIGSVVQLTDSDSASAQTYAYNA